MKITLFVQIFVLLGLTIHSECSKKRPSGPRCPGPGLSNADCASFQSECSNNGNCDSGQYCCNVFASGRPKSSIHCGKQCQKKKAGKKNAKATSSTEIESYNCCPVPVLLASAECEAFESTCQTNDDCDSATELCCGEFRANTRRRGNARSDMVVCGKKCKPKRSVSCPDRTSNPGMCMNLCGGLFATPCKDYQICCFNGCGKSCID